MPIGFSMGMVLEGVILDSIGWRFLYHLSGGLSLALFAVSLWALPNDAVVEESTFTKLKREIDWVGAVIASTCLALLSYVLALVPLSSAIFVEYSCADLQPGHLLVLSQTFVSPQTLSFWCLV